MLKQRIITAIILLAILLPAMFNPTAFALVALAFIAAGAWEWGRLHGCSQRASIRLALVCVLVCAALWRVGASALLWQATGAAWVLVGSYLLARGVPAWAQIAKPIRLVGGVLALSLAWLAIAQARERGIEYLLSALLLVWVADIAAYFFGKAFGGRVIHRKLAASISPGKSWEGAFGAVLGVLLLAFVWGGGVFAHLLQAHGWPLTVLMLVFLTAMSIVGDLVESLIKRSVGVKDSSGLLPGHGGVLDRIDALLPTLPLVMMLSA